jgi:hypothetical protein
VRDEHIIGGAQSMFQGVHTGTGFALFGIRHDK